MGNWSINPNTLASIDDNGNATFQEHTEDVEYTITYNDNVTGTLTKKFMVHGCGEPPISCEEKYIFSPLRTEPIDATGGTSIPLAQSKRINDDDERLPALIPTIVEGGEYLTIRTSSVNSWHRYYGAFTENETTSTRTFNITYNSADGKCKFTQTITQVGKAADCSVYNWLDLGTSVGKESGTAAIANYIKTYGNLVLRDKPEWITAITQETGRLPNVVMVKATYEASSVDRVGRVNFISQSDGCTFSASLTQVNAVGVTVNWYAQRTEFGDGQYGGYYYTTVSNEELPFTLHVTPSLGTAPYDDIHECSEQQASSSYVHFKDRKESPAVYTDYYTGVGKIFCSHTIIMLTVTVSGDTMIIRNGVNVTINDIVYNFTWIDNN